MTFDTHLGISGLRYSLDLQVSYVLSPGAPRNSVLEQEDWCLGVVREVLECLICQWALSS